MTQKLEVWLDCDLVPLQQIGMLSHDRGTVWFEYSKGWLSNPLVFQLDPELKLNAGPMYPKAETSSFGIFLDSAPDRWGQTLMDRRELLQAKDEGRKARQLYSWDYLQGVQDITRQGALRFRPPGETGFVASEALGAPPVTSLGELAEVARELTRRDHNDGARLRRWLSVLVAPGASLGGARPKANFLEQDGSFWIAKFPAYQDRRDVGAWEFTIWKLANTAKVAMPPAKVVSVGDSGYHTFCVKRFDRVKGVRRFYASAMTLLGKEDNAEGSNSYLELAQFLSNHGDPAFIGADLAQLFRRVAFNVAVGNRDDHLRNHGFILGKQGWRLAPAFDVNPNLDKDAHVLNIDDVDNRPSLATVAATAEFYRLTPQGAAVIVEEVAQVVDGWEKEAKLCGLRQEDCLEMARSFEAHEEYRQRSPVEEA